MPKALANKNGINLMIFILNFVENCLQYVFFSEWLRTSSNLARISIGLEAILEYQIYDGVTESVMYDVVSWKVNP